MHTLSSALQALITHGRVTPGTSAHRIGCHRADLSRWAAGTRPVDTDTLAALLADMDRSIAGAQRAIQAVRTALATASGGVPADAALHAPPGADTEAQRRRDDLRLLRHLYTGQLALAYRDTGPAADYLRQIRDPLARLAVRGSWVHEAGALRGGPGSEERVAAGRAAVAAMALRVTLVLTRSADYLPPCGGQE